MPMLVLIILDVNGNTVTLSGFTVSDLYRGKPVWVTIGQSFHDSTLYDGLPSVGRLQNTNVLSHSLAQAFFEVS